MKSAKKKPLAEQLSILDRISRAISEADEIDHLLEKSFSCLMDIADASAGAAYLMRNGAWQLQFSAGFSRDEISEISQLGVRMNHCLNRLSENKDCVFLKLGERHPHYCPGFPKDRRGNHWWTGVAVKSRGGPIGVLSLIGRRNEGSIPITLEVLPILTGFIGAALEKAMLYEETLRKNRELKVYNEIARIISSSTDMSLVLNKCLKLLIGYLRIKGGVVFLRDERLGRLKMIAHQRTPRPMLQVIKEVRHLPYKASPLLTGRTAIIVDFTSTYPFLKKLASSYKFEVFISIPLRSKNKIVGLIDLAGLHKVNLSEINVQLLDAIGNQLGIALDNAQTLTLVTGAEEKYHSIYESSSDILFTTDRTGIITSANPSFQETMGLREKELMGSKLHTFAAKGLGKLVRDILRQSLVKRIPSPKEISLKTRSGSRVISLKLGPLRNSAGEVVGSQGEGQDITERQEAEKALKQSEENFRSLAENAQDGIFILVGDGDQIFVNERAAEITGYTVRELIGMNIRKLLAPAEISKVMERYHRRLAGLPVLKQYETAIIRKDGGLAPIEVTASATTWQGRPAGIAIIRDITRRRDVEREMRKQRDHAQHLLDIAGVLIVAIDVSHKVSMINRKGCEVLGYKESEILGRNWFDTFIPKENRKAVRKAFQLLMKGQIKNIEYYENPVVNKAGELRYIAWHNSILTDEIGRNIGTLSSGEDITDRRSAEMAKEESETQYRMIFENSPVGIFQFDQNGTLTAWNESLSKILGSDRKKLIGLNLLNSLVDKDMLAAVRSALDGKLGHFEGHYVSITGGKSVIIKVDCAPLIVEKGRYLGGIGIMEDITERQRAKDALFETHQKYEKTVSSVSDYLWSASIQDGKWKQEFSTPVARKITGYSQSDFMDDPMLLLRMVHPDDKTIVMEKFKEMMKGSAVVYEHRILRKDGGVRWIRDSAMPTVDENGEVIRIDGIVSDITERKQAEIDAEELRERLLQSEKLAFLGTMAAGVAHEINNPLSVITGMLQELVSKTHPDDRMYMKYLRLRKVADRIGRIVDGLLHFSHQNRVHFVPTDIHLVIEESLSMVREKSAFENIELVKKYADDIPKINVERDQISQVIINLVTNALDAMPEGGRLTISTGYKREKKIISISISDTGVGIDPEAKRKLFTPFYTTKEVGQGTGLGLAISYGIIQSHQGTLEVESELNKGSTFNINLPRGIRSVQKDGMPSFAGGGNQ